MGSSNTTILAENALQKGAIIFLGERRRRYVTTGRVNSEAVRGRPPLLRKKRMAKPRRVLRSTIQELGEEARGEGVVASLLEKKRPSGGGKRKVCTDIYSKEKKENMGTTVGDSTRGCVTSRGSGGGKVFFLGKKESAAFTRGTVVKTPRY